MLKWITKKVKSISEIKAGRELNALISVCDKNNLKFISYLLEEHKDDLKPILVEFYLAYKRVEGNIDNIKNNMKRGK